MLADNRDETPETYVTPARVARRLGTCVQTVHRWTIRGVKLADGGRNVLRADRLPGGWRTTWAWVEEFIARQTADRIGGVDAPPARRSPARRHREYTVASAEAERLGL